MAYIRTDKDGYDLCPLPGCGKPLYLTWSFTVPLCDDPGKYDPNDAPTDAISDSWEVVCENDHTIANSPGSDDNGPAFDRERFVKTGQVE